MHLQLEVLLSNMNNMVANTAAFCWRFQNRAGLGVGVHTKTTHPGPAVAIVFQFILKYVTNLRDLSR